MFDDNNEPKASRGTRAGVDQLKAFDPYTEVKAVTMSNAAGIKTKQFGEEAEKYGSGDMILSGISEGAWSSVTGVDFGSNGAQKINFKVKGTGSGSIRVCLDLPSADPVAVAEVNAPGKELTEVTAELATPITGEHTVFFVFEGSDYEFYSWQAQ